MEKSLHRVMDGDMTFDEFAQATDSRWRKLARMLLRRWQTPASVSEDDVSQELLLGAWLAMPRWREDGGAKLERFVVWHATSAAKDWVHRQRGANLHGSRDRNPSRFDVLQEANSVDPAVSAAQERVVWALERLRLACKLMPSHLSAQALAAVALTGSVDGAMELMRSSNKKVSRRTVISALKLASQHMEV